MELFKNVNGREILLGLVEAIQKNKAYLGEVDGLIGDGDHGMNMNKGFTLYAQELGAAQTSFTDGLNDLGLVLFNKIGGSMGPIYGTMLTEMADAGAGEAVIDLLLFTKMMRAALEGLYGIVDARPGDKTLVDTLFPAVQALEQAQGQPFGAALLAMKTAAYNGWQSTKGMVAKYGRAARLGDRSRGVLDAGATSCYIILNAMADGILRGLEEARA